jgi:hypothetical protein
MIIIYLLTGSQGSDKGRDLNKSWRMAHFLVVADISRAAIEFLYTVGRYQCFGSGLHRVRGSGCGS